MHRRLRWAAFAAASFTVTGGLSGADVARSAPAGAEPRAVQAGRGQAGSARDVDLRHLAPARRQPAPAYPVGRPPRHGPRLPSVPFVPSAPDRPKTARPAAAAPEGPNTGPRPAGQRSPRTSAGVVHANFTGVGQPGSNCGICSSAQVNAAVGSSHIVEVVNTRIQVFSRSGDPLCGNTLAAFWGTSASLLAPRAQYDNLNHRYTLSAVPVPPVSSTEDPRYFVAASKSDDACGGWWVYTVTLHGSLTPPGALLEDGMPGQDRDALLSSTNNFTPGYIGSTAWSIPKANLYAGQGFSFTTFGVAYGTAPVTVAGIPTFPTGATYWLAALPTIGYKLYRMTNSAGPGTALVVQADISSPYLPPLRRVRQPGTTQTLDPLDGRIEATPVQDGDFVWFAHGMSTFDYPAIRYGAIGTRTNTAFTSNAFKTATSDDFNPSIGVSDNGNGQNYIWLNWAYTDTPAGVAATATSNGVGPGEGVPELRGGLDLAGGGTTTTVTNFGNYSSVAVDPVDAPGCPAGRVAVLGQQFFDNAGQFQTRIASLGFC